MSTSVQKKKVDMIYKAGKTRLQMFGRFTLYKRKTDIRLTGFLFVCFFIFYFFVFKKIFFRSRLCKHIASFFLQIYLLFVIFMFMMYE